MDAAWENKDGRKKLNASAQKGLSSMKQKLRRMRTSFEKDLEAFRANPWETEESADERKVESDDDKDGADGGDGDEGDDDADDGFTKAENKKTKKKAARKCTRLKRGQGFEKIKRKGEKGEKGGKARQRERAGG